jgi:hypothetical protein
MFATRWPRWRRDLLIGLIASVLTVAVLSPIALALLREEQQKTAEAHRQVEELTAKVHEHRAAAERLLYDQYVSSIATDWLERKEQ